MKYEIFAVYMMILAYGKSTDRVYSYNMAEWLYINDIKTDKFINYNRLYNDNIVEMLKLTTGRFDKMELK